MKTIKIKVRYDGSEVGIEVDGVKGASCTDLTSKMEEAIFGDNVTKELTPEFYEENPLTNSDGI